MADLADKIAARLMGEWEIGTSSRFCDDPPDWDAASAEEVAAVIRGVIEANQAGVEAPTP